MAEWDVSMHPGITRLILLLVNIRMMTNRSWRTNPEEIETAISPEVWHHLENLVVECDASVDATLQRFDDEFFSCEDTTLSTVLWARRTFDALSIPDQVRAIRTYTP